MFIGHARAGNIRIDISDAILNEINRVLRDKFQWNGYMLHDARGKLLSLANHIAPTEAPPPPIAPPPKTIELGLTRDQVISSPGQPEKIVKLPTKQIDIYKDMKITFVGGKVRDIQ